MSDQIDEKHLEWLVENRAKNQESTLRLYRLMAKHSEQFDDDGLAMTVQSLVAATFSLWRAVFLADNSGRAEPIKAAKEFLKKVIEDNTISYLQDKHAKDWSFHYYLNNTEGGLARLKEYSNEAVPNLNFEWVDSPRERWERAHDLVIETMDIFERDLIKASEAKKK